MNFLLINSMSRTGTSLLYQLLYGCKSITFPPYRVQFVCSYPYGFPIVNIDNYKNDEFIKKLLNKTTIPVGINKLTNWSNIDIKKISDFTNLDKFKKKINNVISDNDNSFSLNSGIKMLNIFFDINGENKKYFCLQDDHSYILGSKYLSSSGISKILTTVRNPVDMIASKKNMLIYNSLGQIDPLKKELSSEALEKELTRSLFSWVVSSYEYYNNFGLPILFEKLKLSDREKVLEKICDYMDIPFEKIMINDQNNISTYSNELLFVESSLKYLTKGKNDDTVNYSKLSLLETEIEKINNIVDLSPIKKIINSDLTNFYKNFGQIWSYYENSKLTVLNEWFKLYKESKTNEVFRKYTSFNYGYKNAKKAFI